MNNKLIDEAIKMRKRSYAPYSKYRVGAAVETESGNIIGGCNVESSSYGLTCCAERTALFRAIAEGYKQFIGIAIATKNLQRKGDLLPSTNMLTAHGEIKQLATLKRLGEKRAKSYITRFNVL